MPEAGRGTGELVPVELRRRLVALRRELHEHPELAFAERRTSRRLRDELAALDDCKITEVAETGLVVRVPGRDRSRPPVAVRGDMDALPIEEESGVAYASRAEGRMHACGHDVHATWTVGAGLLLSREPADGDVLLVFQPAEETAEGARLVLDSGALDDAAVIFGGHVDTRYAVGTVVAQEGPLAAATDFFRVELVGEGAHSGRPHEGRDAAQAGAALTTALYAISGRRLHPAAPAVVTVGRLEAGAARNAVAGRCVLEGTLRSTSDAAQDLLREEVRRIADSVAAAHRVEAETRIERAVPPLVNDERATACARGAVRDLLGEDALQPLDEPNLAGEDFAFYLEELPGCFLRIGARGPNEEIVPAHSPRFLPHEDAIGIGAAVLAEAARRASADLAARDRSR